MFDKKITLFNYHSPSKMWYPSVIPATDIGCADSSGRGNRGTLNSDNTIVLIHCSPDKVIHTSAGDKCYTPPKSYAKSETPENVITFSTEDDFIYDGEWGDLTPISDEQYDSGLYHELNNEYDGVYLINSVSYFSLIPHFEIGGR